MRHKQTRKKRNKTNQRRRPVQKRKVNRRSRAKGHVSPPRTAKQFFAMSKQAQGEWTKATKVVSEARATGFSPRKVSKQFGISFESVLRLVGRAFRKQRNGRYAPRPTDKLLRVLIIPTKNGLREIATCNSRQASLASHYWIALNRYLTKLSPV